MNYLNREIINDFKKYCFDYIINDEPNINDNYNETIIKLNDNKYRIEISIINNIHNKKNIDKINNYIKLYDGVKVISISKKYYKNIEIYIEFELFYSGLFSLGNKRDNIDSGLFLLENNRGINYPNYNTKYIEKFKETRNIVIKWIIDVCKNMNISNETLHYSIILFDMVMIEHYEIVEKCYIQAYASVCIYISSHLIEIIPFEDCSDLGPDIYTNDKYSDIHDDILKVLDYNLYIITIYSFFQYYKSNYNLDEKQIITINEKMLEFYLNDNYLKFKPSEIALYIIKKVVHANNIGENDDDENIIYISSSSTLGSISDAKQHYTNNNKTIFLNMDNITEYPLSRIQRCNICNITYKNKSYIIKYHNYTNSYLLKYDALKEISILKQVNHPNCMKLEYIVHKYNKIGIVIKKYDYTLKTCINNNNLTYKMIHSYIHQILKGIEYLHFYGITHRDIKPKNIVINSNNNVKIIDYDHSIIKSDNNNNTKNCCTFYYRSIEILLELKYNNKIDLWSCGCVLYEMVNKKLLFDSSCNIDMIFTICKFFGTDKIKPLNNTKIKLPFYKDTNNNKYELFKGDMMLNRLFEGLITPDPEKRFSASDALTFF